MKATLLSSLPQVSLLPSSARVRTGLIFFAGIFLMLAVTFVISGIVSRGINRDEVVVLLLEQKSAEVELWTEMTLDGPKSAGTELDVEWLLTLLMHGGVLPASGGMPMVIPQAADVGLRRILEDVMSTWNEANTAAHQLASEPNNTVARQQFQDHNLTLQHGLINATNLFRQRLHTNTGMIRGLFAALFLSTLAFLLIGLWFMEQIVLLPLDALHATAHRIAAGDLDTPVALTGSGEFLKLAHSFEGMRSELQLSRDQLVGSAKELEQEVTQRTEQFTALTHVISLASQSLEMEEMLATAMDAAINALGVEIGALWLLDKNRGDLRLAVSRGMSTTMREELRVLAIGEGATGSAVQLRQTIVLEDISQEPHAVHPVTVRENIFSLIAAPVMVRDRILGAVDVATRQERRFAPVEVALLTSIGQHIGVAVDGLQLLTEARGQAQSLAQLHEREKISAELHDGLLQTLSYLYLKIDQLGNAATNAQYTQLERQCFLLGGVLEQASEDLRQFIADLRYEPSPPSDELFHILMRETVTAFQQQNSAVQVTLDQDGRQLRLAPNQSTQLLRIVSEALANAVNHGKGQRIKISCRKMGTHGQLQITDNGSGFNPDQLLRDDQRHFGLSIMAARAERINGKLRIDSAPGRGTHLVVDWPLAVAHEVE